jgi:hypothetical protein
MLDLSPSQQYRAAAEGIIFSCESARTGSTDIPSIAQVVSDICERIASGREASDFNKSSFAAVDVKQILLSAGINVRLPGQLNNNDAQTGFYSGVIYGYTGNENPTLSALPKDFAIDERDKSGRDISKEIAVATLRVYNFLANSENNQTQGIRDLSDISQVIKCISQLIAANVTSDRNILHGSLFAAMAVGEHFYKRSIIIYNDNSLLIPTLAGVIMSAFGAKSANLAPLHDFPKIEASNAEPSDIDLTLSRAPTMPDFNLAVIAHENEELYHKQNTHELTKEQCRFLAKVLRQVVDESSTLDSDLDSEVLRQLKPETLNRLGRDILEVEKDIDSSVADLNLSGPSPKTQPISIINAVAYRLEQSPASSDLNLDYLKLVVRAIELAKDGIVEHVSYDLPRNFLNEFSEQTLREFAEDCLCETNDPSASIEDMEPLTSKNLGATTNLCDCLDAYSFRLGSITQARE